MSPRKPPSGKGSSRLTVVVPLGAQLKRLRLERNLSQGHLAALTGLNYKYIGRVELGRADPGAITLIRLAQGLGVSVGELFETITPSAGGRRLSPAEVKSVSSALASLTTAVDGLLKGEPVPIPRRAGRTRGRRANRASAKASL